MITNVAMQEIAKKKKKEKTLLREK